MEYEPITGERIDELLGFLPLFDVPDEPFVERWGGGRQPDGTIQMPFPVYTRRVQEFFRLAAHPCWSDYGYEPVEAGAMLADDAAIERAGLPEIKSMLTYCVRGERFCDGHWESVLRAGRVTRLLRRLRELRDTVA